MTKRQITEKIPFKLLAVFVLLAAGICAGGLIFYKQQRSRTVAHIQEDLDVIAQLKSEEITAWRRERYGDAFVITRSQLFASSVRRWYNYSGDRKLRDYIYKRLDAFRIYETYKDVILVDPDGKTKMFIDQGGSENLSKATLDIVDQAERQNRIIFSDFYYCEKCREVHLDVITPLHEGQINAGALILRINPNKYLYPLIQKWPSGSKSGETVLVRKEGNEVVYLNELRHQKGAAMKLRLPLTDALLPASMAARGKEGMVEGIDYRGVPVVAAVKHIADSPWYMVAKVDKDEVYAPLKRQARNIMFVTILTIAALAAVLSFIWQADRRGFYKKQYQLEMEKQALVKHFDYLTKYANDIIFLLDQDRRIVEINDRGVEAYGYSREELLGREAGIVRAEEQREKFKVQMEELKDKGALLYETMHRKKDGTAFPVEISARTIEIEGKKYLQGIVRDITERKHYEQKIQDRTEELEASNEQLMASEEELRTADEELRQQMEELQQAKEKLAESEEKYRLVFEAANVGKSMTLPGGEVQANQAFCDMLGYSCEEMKHKTWQELTPPEDVAAVQGLIEPLIKGEKDSIRFNKRYLRKDGAVIWTDLSTVARRDPNGKLLNFITTVVDITERKQYELEIQERKEELEAANQELVAAEEELRQQMDELQRSKEEIINEKIWSDTLIQSAPNMVVGLGEKSKILFFNNYAEKLTGYKADEVMGKNWIDLFIPEELRTQIYMVWDEIIKSKRIEHQYENPVLTKNKETRLISWNNSYLTENGKFKMVLSLGQDITEQKQAEIVLRTSEDRYRKAETMGGVGNWEYNIQTTAFWGSDEAKRIYGFDPNKNDFTTDEVENCIPERDRVHQALVDLIENDKEYDLEFEIHPKDSSSSKIITSKAELRRDDQGKPLKVVGVIQDITERKQAEVKIIENEQKFRQLAENIDIVFWLTDWTEKKLLYVNQAYEKVFGLTVESAYSDRLGWKKAVHPDDQEWVSQELQNHALKEEFTELEYRIICQGKVKWIHEQAFPLKDEIGRVIRFINVADDITERKLAEEKVKNQLAELQQWQSVMLNREDRVRALKDEVNHLLRELGRPEAYGPSA